MIPALNKTELDNEVTQRYGQRKSRIVGLMMVRYSGNNKPYIDNNYLYWDKITSENFDIFWPGYGKYGYEEDNILKFDGNKYAVYFDLNAYVEVTNALRNSIKKFKPNDGGPILILLNYRNGFLDYTQALVIKLVSKNNIDPFALQKTINYINELVYQYDDIRDVHFKYRALLENSKNNLSVRTMDLLNLAVALYGVVPK